MQSNYVLTIERQRLILLLFLGIFSIVHKVHRMEEECPQENRRDETMMQTTVTGPNTSSDNVCDNRARASCQEEFTCSLYISRAVGPQGQVQGIPGGKLPTSLFSVSSTCISGQRTFIIYNVPKICTVVARSI